MLLNYKKQFIDAIKIGTKVHTIRGRRKNKPKIGETLHMFSGLRTKNSELITKKEKLISTQKVWIKIVFRLKPTNWYLKICVDGRVLSSSEIEAFVRFDGFSNIQEFIDFFTNPYKKNVRQNNMEYKFCKIIESKTLYHWTDLRY